LVSKNPRHAPGRLVAGPTPRSPGFDPKTVHVRWVVDKVALERVFLRVLQFLPVTVTPPELHTHLHLHDFLITQTKGRMCGNLQSSAHSEIGKHRIENTSITLDLKGLSSYNTYCRLLTKNILLIHSQRTDSYRLGKRPPSQGEFRFQTDPNLLRARG